MRQRRINRRRSKRSGSKARNSSKKSKVIIQNTNSQREVGRISLPKLKMIGNMLPTEATHSSLDLFEKPALLVTFDGSFCQKVEPVYSPNGPMLEFEVAGDRNNFIDLQKIFLEIKCKIIQASEAELKYDAGAAADVTKTDAPYFCNNVLHSLFSDCTVSANGQKKFQMQMEIMLTKVSLKPNNLTTKTQMLLGWLAKVIRTRIILE